MEKQQRCRGWRYGLIGLSLLLSMSAYGADNMKLHGALVAEPCVIAPGDEAVELDFGTVVDKYLYLNGRTLGNPFTLHLSQCDLSLGRMVKITFSGTENSRLPGLLALAGGSTASGIAIGLETEGGKALPLSHASDKYPLVADNNLITLKAYVQGEPQAISGKTIGRGAFTSVATFNLEYE